MRHLHPRAFLALLVFAAPLSASSQATGAKDLFYDPAHGDTVSVQLPASPPTPPSHIGKAPVEVTPQPAVAKSIPHRRLTPGGSSVDATTLENRGLHYWVELEKPNGSGYYTTGERVFRSGERIRLHFVGNTDGRILLIQTGTSGTSKLLFPDPGKGLADNHLKAGQDRLLPSETHWFRFDDHAGTERLLVLFARDTADLERFPVKPEMDPTETKALIEAANHVQGSKDLVIETETRAASEVGTYGVNLKGEPVVLEIALQHR